jgi:hypothetical protein
MTTANQKLDFLIGELTNVKTDSKIKLPLVGDLTLLRNQDLDEATKNTKMQELVLIAYAIEYTHTRTKAMIGSGSRYGSLTTAMNGILLDDSLDRIFQGQAKVGGTEGKHQDTVIFNSAKDPVPIVKALFTDALISGFMDNKNGKQIFANAMKAVRGMGDAAILTWNDLATSKPGTPPELLISGDLNLRSESNFKAQFDKLNSDVRFKHAILNSYMPLALNHFMQEVPILRDEMAKQIKIYEKNPAEYDIETMHAIVTKAYLHEYLDNRTKGTFSTVESPELKRFEALIHEFSVKTNSSFLSAPEKGLDFVEPTKTSYDAIARSVASVQEREALVEEAFERTVKLFINPADASKFVFINSQKFVQALGPDAIKSWNQRVANFDTVGHEIFPNLMMDRQSNNEVTIKSRWDSLMEKDINELNTIMSRPVRKSAVYSPKSSAAPIQTQGLFSPSSSTQTPPSPPPTTPPPALLSSINKTPK